MLTGHAVELGLALRAPVCATHRIQEAALHCNLSEFEAVIACGFGSPLRFRTAERGEWQ